MPSYERWEKVGLSASMALHLAFVGLLVGLVGIGTIVAFTTGLAIAPPPVYVLKAVPIGSVAVFGVAGGVFAWTRPVVKVRRAATISGAVVFFLVVAIIVGFQTLVVY